MLPGPRPAYGNPDCTPLRNVHSIHRPRSTFPRQRAHTRSRSALHSSSRAASRPSSWAVQAPSHPRPQADPGSRDSSVSRRPGSGHPTPLSPP
ncbi:hypothetical protein VTO73DRAFT_6101 [Trametes versicolor]